MLPEVPFFEGFWYLVFALVAMIAWRIWGDRAMRAIRRIDQRRRDAELQAYADRMNPNAHFRQSVDQINDETSPVVPGNGRTATWNGQTFATREEAEAARWRHVLTQARDFYKDLDRTFGNKIRGPNKDTLN